ncbi:transposase [Rhizobium sp. AC44/96]|nr:transposase [Rhizobium sp. AC44/96]
MGTKIARAAFLVAAMMFFAVLALDIAVPALVLGLMALSTWPSHERPVAKRERRATA